MPPLGIADGLMEFNTPQATGTLLEKTRPPCFVMWSLSATAIVAMHSCAPTGERVPDNPRGDDSRSAICVAGEEPTFYEFGDIPCAREFVRISDDEHMEIRFTVTDENATDRYDYGYWELLRYGEGRVIETLRLRQSGDVHWSETPFVRIRRQQYLADLDGDGHLEFAVFPFSPGSAIWGTVRIYSIKDKIEPWGLGRLRFEQDTFVQLDCMRCSRFSPEECEKCR